METAQLEEAGILGAVSLTGQGIPGSAAEYSVSRRRDWRLVPLQAVCPQEGVWDLLEFDTRVAGETWNRERLGISDGTSSV